jgi:hypothetical protein
MDDFRARMKELTEQIDGAEGFADHIDSDMVLEALAATSDVKVRRRKFPAERIVWLIVGMGLYANVSIRNIVTTMRLTIKGRVVSSAISQARARMGFKPIKWLFELLASNWRKECAASTWKGLSLMGFDGPNDYSEKYVKKQNLKKFYIEDDGEVQELDYFRLGPVCKAYWIRELRGRSYARFEERDV